MHNISLKNRQIIAVIVLVGLLAALPVAIFLAQRRQETRGRAAGTGEIKVVIRPASANIQQGTSLSSRVVLINGTTSPKQIYVAGMDFSYDPAFFTISNLACGSALSNSAKALVTSNNFYLSCFIAGGSGTYTIPAGATVILGTFTISISTGAQLNIPSEIIVIRTNIPDAVTGEDLSNAGTGAIYTIIPGTIATATISPVLTSSPTPTIVESTTTPTTTPTATPTSTPIPPTPTPTRTLTPTPTRTPTPIPTETPTPIPTETPVPTITPEPTWTPTPTEIILPPTDTPMIAQCPAGDLGNLNCDSLGIIDESDLSILLTKWYIGACPAPAPSAEQASADLNGDCNVDEIDLSKLLINWKAS